MATNAEIRAAVHDAIADVPKLNTYRYPPESIQVPAAIVAGLDINRSTFDGNRNVGVTVLVVVSHSDPSQIELLDALLDPTSQASVLTALDEAPGSGGVSLSWDNVSGYGEVMWGGVSYYGAAVSMTAYT